MGRRDRAAEQPQRTGPAGYGSGLGATVAPGVGVHFRVWAPRARTVDVLVEQPGGPEAHPLALEGDGAFAGLVRGLGAGARYRYRLDGGDAFPDPCSRSQPEGVHGPSEVVDPAAFTWRDAGWPGLDARRLVIYECHVGTATPAGTFDGLISELGSLRRLGVTALELMPVAAFPGRWNWGYDGVYPYAPAAVYGGPDGLRRLVDAAHRRGLGVILDVVYNHLGPDGNYLATYAQEYYSDRHRTPWGDALSFDGPRSGWVRRYVIENACHWLVEYHLDGLRLDAVHAIHDTSPRHVVAEIVERARAAVGRPVVIIAESDANDVRLIDPPERGGFELDAVWADDFHHALHVYLTGERDGYYQDYSGRLSEVARTIPGGFLYQGEVSPYLGRPRGTRVGDQPAWQFIFALQNHDQVGNRAFGERLNHLVDAARYAVASALLLLVPESPLLFMGQEFAASSPFLYFTDHHAELGRLVTAGRREEFKAFSAFRDPRRREQIPDPQAESTFFRSKLDLAERERQAGMYRLYRDLIRLRRSDPVLAEPDRDRLTACAVRDDLLALHRWSGAGHRLVLASFGDAVKLDLASEPTLAGVPSGRWRTLLTTSARRYGGTGARAWLRWDRGRLEAHVPARAAAIFALGDG